jgi:hypothetical protein
MILPAILRGFKSKSLPLREENKCKLFEKSTAKEDTLT